MRNISPSSSNSKSDVILLDLGRDYHFRGLFLALLLPSLDLDLGLDLDLLLGHQLTRTNHCHFPPFYKQQLLDLRLISCQTYSDPSTRKTSNIFLGWLALITIDADGKTIWSLRKIECTFASWTLSINGFIERRVLGRIKCEPEIRRRTVQGLKLLRWRVPVAVFYMSYRGAKLIPQGLRPLPTGNF